MHAGLISCLLKVLHEAGVPYSTMVTEVQGMHGHKDHSRPGDIVILDYVAMGKHVMFDGVVSSASRNTRVRETRSIPGYAVKLVEDMKFNTDMTLERPVSISHAWRMSHASPLFSRGRWSAWSTRLVAIYSYIPLHKGR
jgi:hypothetical protein